MKKKQKTSQPLVVLIVLNWNGIEYTKNCIKSLLKVNYYNKKIILLDNGSDNNEYEKLKVMFPQIDVIYSKTNRGFAGGNNLALKYAEKYEPKYSYLLNNDFTFDKNFLIKLVEVMEKDETIGTLGAKMNYMDYPDTIWSIGGKINPITGKSKLLLNKKKDIYTNTKKIVDVDYSNGLVRHSVYKKIGYLDEKYFIYNEETEFCLKLKKLGYKVQCRLDSTSYHKVSLTDYKISGFSVYYITRNRFYFMKKNFPFINRLAFYITFFLFYMPVYTILYPINAKKLGVLKIFYRGILDGIYGKMGKTTIFEKKR